VATDAASIVAALVLAYGVRYGDTGVRTSYAVTIALAPFAWTAIFYCYGLYRSHQLSEWDEFRRTLSAVSVGIVVVATGSFWTHSDLSRKWIAVAWLLALSLELSTRAYWRKYASRLRRTGRLTMRTVIVGESQEAQRLAKDLAAPSSGHDPIGFVSTGPNGEEGAAKSLTTIHGLEDFIRSNSIDCVFVAAGAVTPAEMTAVSRAARRTGAELRISTSLPDMLTSPLTIQSVAGGMVVALRGAQLTGLQLAAKRIFDVVVSSVLLLVALPIMVLCGAAVRLTSRGPVLFRQARITRGSRPFVMYKLRTMFAPRDSDGDLDTSSPFFKLANDDPRITPVGRFLRKWSLDELPQLLNVLKGDMSLVGPRPLPAEQVEAHMSLLAPRHEVSAGVSGWWQISGRSDLTPDAAIALDLYYIDNWSLALDVFILLKTLGAVFAKRGAY
jgi:exopolysaccharide biosynthesis polyprenyl glycosylphosphotransferase